MAKMSMDLLAKPLVVLLLKKNVWRTLPQAACSFYCEEFISHVSCDNLLVFMLVSGRRDQQYNFSRAFQYPGMRCSDFITLRTCARGKVICL